MTAYYFGEPWDAPAVDDAVQLATPVGERCYDCGDPIGAGDRGWIRPHIAAGSGNGGGPVAAVLRPVHAECDLRSIMGHMVGVCSCTGHEPGRDTGRLVWAAVFAGR